VRDAGWVLDPSRTHPARPAHRIESIMSEPKQPTDHKKPAKFTFDADGKTYTLPLATKGIDKLSGRDLREAALGGEAGQVAYLFKLLEAAEPSKAALEALYDMPQSKVMDVLQAWGEFGDGDGASLGK
jgi:hypothetical protein